MITNQLINGLFAIHQMCKNTTLNFNGKKETIGQSKQKAAKEPLGHRVKQPPSLFKNSAVWRASY